MEDDLALFLKDNKIIYLEIYDPNKNNEKEYGDVEKLPYRGLYQELIGDKRKKENLLRSLENDLEYQTWRQGTLSAMAIRNKLTLICMFYINEKRGIEGREISQKIFTQICKLI